MRGATIGRKCAELGKANEGTVAKDFIIIIIVIIIIIEHSVCIGIAMRYTHAAEQSVQQYI